MNNAILISIRPKWVAKILNGEKTLEIRKTAPKCKLPIDVYVYCTKGDYLHHNKNGWFVFDMPTTFIAKEDFVTVKEQKPFNGKVVAKFTLKKVEEILALPTEIGCSYQTVTLPFKFLMKKSCVNSEGFNHYLKCKNGYGWHISDLEIFEEPKELDQFEYLNQSGIRYVGQRELNGQKNKKHPPQSWCYVEAKE